MKLRMIQIMKVMRMMIKLGATRSEVSRGVEERGCSSSIRSVRAAHPSFASAKSKEMLKQFTRNSVCSNPARFARAVRDMALVNLCMRDVVKDFQERAEKDV